MDDAGDRWYADGIIAANARTDEVDVRIRRALEHERAGSIVADGNVALVAVGSYGRRELVCHSDIDLLLLHRLRAPQEIESATKALLYPLWDCGFEIGHAVRTIDQCLDSAKADPIIATTLLDVRPLIGNNDLANDLSASLDNWSRRRRNALERALFDALEGRHRRFGDAGIDIEPHLKEARGGLRDLQTLRWIDPSTDAREPLSLLLSVRHALHEAARRRLDRLERQFLDQTIANLGVATSDGADARDVVMKAIFESCREVGIHLDWRIPRRARRRKQKAPHGFAVVDGRLEPAGVAPVEADPSSGFEAARAAGAYPPGPRLIEWAAAGKRPLPWTPESTDAALDVMRDGDKRAWEMLDATGLWLRYFPDFTGARAKTQHNPLHSLAVDAHCWQTLRQAISLATDPTVQFGESCYSELDDPDTLLLAALMHDMGKGVSGDHSRAGVIIARKTLERMSAGASIQGAVAFAVSNHLLLSKFATTRDLGDEELVTALAAKIETSQRLRLLYLLTIADSRATGSSAWSSWKASLLAELFTKCAHIIDNGDLVSRESTNRHERTRNTVKRRLISAGMDQDHVSALVDSFGRRFLLRHEPEAITLLIPAVEEVAKGIHIVRLMVHDSTVTVIGPDHPGLLASITGVLTASGCSVRSAEVHTRSDGVAVDVMTVEPQRGRPLSQLDWRMIETNLAAAVTGDYDTRGRVAHRANLYDNTAGSDVVVNVDNEVSDWYSVVDVSGNDRIGLLYDITAALADLGADVHFAKVSTEGGVARDSFNVRDATGAKYPNPEEFAAAISAAVNQRSQVANEALYPR